MKIYVVEGNMHYEGSWHMYIGTNIEEARAVKKEEYADYLSYQIWENGKCIAQELPED